MWQWGWWNGGDEKKDCLLSQSLGVALYLENLDSNLLFCVYYWQWICSGRDVVDSWAGPSLGTSDFIMGSGSAFVVVLWDNLRGEDFNRIETRCLLHFRLTFLVIIQRSNIDVMSC